MLGGTRLSSNASEKTEIHYLLRHRENASTVPSSPESVRIIDFATKHSVLSVTGACNLRSLPLLQTRTEGFPTPESLHVSSPEELSHEPLVPHFPDEKQLAELFTFFVENLLRWVPVLLTDDIGLSKDMVRNDERLLLYSMAYVAAGFIPGCKTLRAELAPSIVAYVKQCTVESSIGSGWIALQAITILYNWTMPKFHLTLKDQMVPDPPLTHDALSILWDRLAFAQTAQSASQDAAKYLEHYSRGCDIRKDIRVQRYLCWLWMYTITTYRTWLIKPVTIAKADPAVYDSRHIFRDHLTDEVVGSIIARVELCLILERLSHVGPEVYNTQSDPTSLRKQIATPQERWTILRDLGDDLDSWYREWSPRWTKCGSYEPLEAYHRFTRFCIIHQATKLCQSCTTSEMSPNTTLDLVETAIEQVSNLCSVLLELDPLSSYGLCFIPEDVFALVLYGCEYVLAAQATLTDLGIRREKILLAMAELMIDVGTYDKEWTASRGYSLLRQLGTRLSSYHANNPSDAFSVSVLTSN